MATILLTWELGGGTGHCVNLRPIAEELVERGHHVCFAARDLAAAKRVFQQLPVDYWQAPFLVGRPASPIRAPETFAQILHNVGFGDADELQVLIGAWRNLMRLVKPTAIVCEHSPTALVASRWNDLSRFVIGTGFFSPPDVSPLPDVRSGTTAEVSVEARACEERILQQLNDLLAADRLPQLAHVARLYAETDLSFLLTFSELDHYSQRDSAQYFGTWSPPGGLTAQWPIAEGHRVFAYLQPPSTVWRLESILSVLREFGLPTIAYIPGSDTAWLKKFQTQRLRFVTARVDVGHVARNCDLAILNGNAGTSTELLLAGIPQLLIPLHLEQAVFSQRVGDLGAAAVARPDRPEQIAARLVALISNPLFKAKAQAFAERYAGYGARAEQQRIVDRIGQSVGR